MRMRHKKNLDERMDKVKDQILLIDTYETNPYEAIKDRRLIDCRKVFGNDNPLVVEIGCGRGGFAVEYAKLHLDENYIAVEKISNVIVEACELNAQVGLSNLRFINSAGEYLNRYIPDHSVKAIYINFPCPFFKKTYKNRRLTNIRYLKMYAQMLREDGAIFHKTDNKEFFDYTVEQMNLYGMQIVESSLDLTNSSYDNIVTEYEKKFIEDGRKIYYLKAVL